MTERLPIRLAAGSGPTFGVDDLACAAATHLGGWHDEGLDVSWTPVHGGVAAMNAVLDGSVEFSITVPNATKVFGSQITVLAALAENRLPVLPDAPTAKEQGVDLGLGDASQGWGGFAIKAGTPDDRRDKLVAVFEKWLKSDEFTEKAVALNLTPHYSTPAEFRVTWELGREGLAPLVEKLLKSGN